MKNGNVSQMFKIKNPSNQDVKLKEIVTSCMCTTAYLNNGDEALSDELEKALQLPAK